MSVFYSFSKSGALRAKISQQRVLNHYFGIFNMLLEYVLIMLLIYAMNMLYSPILRPCGQSVKNKISNDFFWTKLLNTNSCMIFLGQIC